jgi:hypothetical protein
MESSTSTTPGQTIDIAPVLMGQKRLDQKDMTQEDWVELISLPFDKIKSRLNYLSWFVSVYDFAGRPEAMERRKAISVCNCVVPPLDKEGSNKYYPECFFLANIPLGNIVGPLKEKVPVTALKLKIDCSLLITKKGNIFLWFETYEGAGYTDISMVSVRLIEAFAVQFAELPLTSLRSQPVVHYGGKVKEVCLGLEIIISLQKLLRGSIDQKQEHIEGLIGCISPLEEIIRHTHL